MKYEICPGCRGKGVLTESEPFPDDKSYAEVTCTLCGGTGRALDSAKNPEQLARDDPGSMRNGDYQAEWLGVVIFLIAAFVIGLNQGISRFHLAATLGKLPLWYYLSITAVPGLLAYYFRPLIATVTLLAVIGAFFYYTSGLLLTVM